MNFRVGPYLYRVVPVAGYIEHEGDRCLGLCDNERHELRISDQCSAHQQIQVVCHEYMEAWLYHFGEHLETQPDKEGYCDLFGVAMTQFVLDFIHEFQRGDGLSEAISQAPPRCVHEEVTDPDPDTGRWRMRMFAAGDSEAGGLGSYGRGAPAAFGFDGAAPRPEATPAPATH